jgi:hypothetical protein
VEIIEEVETPQTAEQTDKIDTIRAELKTDFVGKVLKQSVILYRIMGIYL